jgi:hypothetical protein
MERSTEEDHFVSSNEDGNRDPRLVIFDALLDNMSEEEKIPFVIAVHSEFVKLLRSDDRLTKN